MHGPTPPYPADWKALAEAVKTMDGWKCRSCGHPHEPDAGYTLTVHHRDGDTFNNTPDNLVSLCQRCHLAAQGRLHASCGIRAGFYPEFRRLQGRFLL